MVSSIFDASLWEEVLDLLSPISLIIVRAERELCGLPSIGPEVRNAFRPQTVDELYLALDHARQWSDVGTVLITGNGLHPRMQDGRFCSGGDQRIRGKDGYKYEEKKMKRLLLLLGRLHILEVQRLIRFMPKVVIAVVNGWAVGGGHSLHVVCDLTIASKEHAIFKQTDPDVASFEFWLLAPPTSLAKLGRNVLAKFSFGRNYTADEAYQMGMVNLVVPHQNLETTALEWGKTINSKVPQLCECSSSALTCWMMGW